MSVAGALRASLGNAVLKIYSYTVDGAGVNVKVLWDLAAPVRRWCLGHRMHLVIKNAWKTDEGLVAIDSCLMSLGGTVGAKSRLLNELEEWCLVFGQKDVGKKFSASRTRWCSKLGPACALLGSLRSVVETLVQRACEGDTAEREQAQGWLEAMTGGNLLALAVAADVMSTVVQLIELLERDNSDLVDAWESIQTFETWLSGYEERLAAPYSKYDGEGQYNFEKLVLMLRKGSVCAEGLEKCRGKRKTRIAVKIEMPASAQWRSRAKKFVGEVVFQLQKKKSIWKRSGCTMALGRSFSFHVLLQQVIYRYIYSSASPCFSSR